MPANTIVIPIKAIYSNGNVTALGELNSGDKLSSDFLNLSSYVANAEFQSFVANTNLAIAAAQGEVSNSYLTSTYVANTAFQSFVANTNAYIDTKSLTITQANTTANTESYSNITTIQFDEDSGFDVTNPEAGVAKIAMNSTFKYWQVDGTTELTATGLDTVNFITGQGITLSSNGTSSPQSLTISTEEVYASNSALQSYIANTNTWLTASNTAIADRMQVANTNTLVNDRMQVANVNLLVNDRIQIANLNTTLADYWPSSNVITHVSTELAALVDSAPSTLDTLNELAAALGDDANFATTLTTNLGQKLGATASVTLTGDVTGSGSFSSNSVSIALTDTNLGNTNAYIASESARIDLVNTNLTGTNTAIRTLVSDRMQVANVVSYTAKYLEVANSASLGDVSNSYLTSTYTTNNSFQSFVANTNAYIASVSASAGLSNTEVNTLIDAKIQVLDVGDVVGADGNSGQILFSSGDGTAYWSNNNPSVDLSGYVGNTYLTSTFTTNTAFQSALANTNLAVNDRMQVANVTSAISTAIANLVDTAPSTLDTLNELAAALGDDANFSATVTTSLAGKASNAAFQSALANTNAYIATKTDDTVALATNTALRTLISDRMQVANVISYTAKYLEVANSASLGEVSNSYLTSTYTTNTSFQSFVANTNAYIASVSASAGLSNTEVNTLIDAKIQVLDVGDVVGADGNSGQILFSYGDGTAYWSNNNPSVDLSGYVGNTYLQSTFVSNTAFQSFVANTNAAIANAGDVSNSYLTSTYTSNTTFQSFVANTNAYIATKTDDTVALSTNTALRTLISDRVQVANLNSTLSDYWPSANVIAHVSGEITSLIDSAPGALDTLNELAAALGDDANFSATVTTSLASKAANSYVNSTFVSNTAFQSFVANTNAYIAASAGSGGLSNTEVDSRIDAKIQVLDIGDIVNADGTAGQVLVTNGDGTGYWANVETGSSFEYVYFASNNQTSFSGADFYSQTLSYTAGKIAVFMNGVKLLRTDYTAANGTHVVLQSGAAANDSIEILSFNGSRLVI